MWKEGLDWKQSNTLPGKKYTCGYCGIKVGSNQGYFGTDQTGSSDQVFIYICPYCYAPSFFLSDWQIPGPMFGEKVEHLPMNIDALYREIRNCFTVNAYTAAVLLCRKLLMNIAVEQGAPEGLPFVKYVDFFEENGFIPPNGRFWVDHIRQKGNEANHQIVLMSRADAENLVMFVEMLLKFNFEFPERLHHK